MGMEKKKQELLIEDIAVYIYLYIPIVLFLFTWIRPVLAYMACGILLFCSITVLLHRKVVSTTIYKRKNLIWLFLLLILMLLWCIMSGQGALVTQAVDWEKHNALLSDLINHDWPVRYFYERKKGTLVYYVGAYLLPALFGKMGGIEVAEVCLLVWCWIGLILVGIKCWSYIDGEKCWTLVAVGFGMILFSTFISQMTELYGLFLPEDLGDGVYWMSKSIRIQYSSNIVQLRWVFPQAIPAWLVTIMIMEKRKEIRNWGLICAPLILYSTFSFLGIVLIVLQLLIVEWYRRKSENKVYIVKEIFSSHNMAALFILCILAGYLAGNILQFKPEEATMGLTLLDYSDYKKLFVLFHLSWGLWIVLLFWKEQKDVFFYISSVSLLLFPFFSMGAFNDLCMRGSIPALFMLCVLVTKQILNDQNRKIYRVLLLSILLVSSFSSQKELLGKTFENGIHRGNRNAPYNTLTELMEEFAPAIYQYVDWNVENGINHWIVR